MTVLDVAVTLAAGVVIGLLLGLLIRTGGTQVDALTADVKPDPKEGKP